MRIARQILVAGLGLLAMIASGCASGQPTDSISHVTEFSSAWHIAVLESGRTVQIKRRPEVNEANRVIWLDDRVEENRSVPIARGETASVRFTYPIEFLKNNLAAVDRAIEFVEAQLRDKAEPSLGKIDSGNAQIIAEVTGHSILLDPLQIAEVRETKIVTHEVTQFVPGRIASHPSYLGPLGSGQRAIGYMRTGDFVHKHDSVRFFGGPLRTAPLSDSMTNTIWNLNQRLGNGPTVILRGPNGTTRMVQPPSVPKPATDPEPASEPK